MEVQAEMNAWMNKSCLCQSSELSIEQALSQHASVLEAVVVSPQASFDDPVLTVIVTLKDGIAQSQELLDELARVAQTASGRAHLKLTMLIVPAMPKTRSGKIRRRLLVDAELA